MKSIRIGKDIAMTWTVTTNGEAISLEGRDLKLIMTEPKGSTIELPFTTSGNTVSMTYFGTAQKNCGTYSLTLWENYGKSGQTAVDKTKAFRLVPNTDLEREDE